MARPSHQSTPSIRKPSVPLSRRRRGPASPTLPKPVLYVLRTVILLLVLWYELGVFWWSTSSCHFAPSVTTPTGKPFNVLVVADPQLLDMRSYPGRNWALRWLGVKFTDGYARKAWRFVVRSSGEDGQGVDGVVWLGDLLDGGVEAVEPAEHNRYVHRFNTLFPLPRQPSTSLTPHLSAPIPSILLPGNHDLGLHLASPALASYARERFTDSFGATSGEKEWGGWSVVWVDSMALLEDEGGSAARGFVEAVAERKSDLPRILLSHIPLYRPEGTACGDNREHQRPIYNGQGANYQNELDRPTSEWLLRTLAPTLVYSGDDHDACMIWHDFPSTAKSPAPPTIVGKIRETTVKAFSMAMGVRNPGYHLLSLSPPTPSTPAPYTQVSCTLPDQLSIWLDVYTPLALLLLASLLLPKFYVAVAHARSLRRHSLALSNGQPAHKHTRSLSRKIFSPVPSGAEAFDLAPGEASSDSDADQQFPTFPFASPHVGYHSGLDSDALPTSSAPGSPSRVRRVSRVWAWEDGSPSASPSLPIYRRRSSAHPDDVVPSLAILGPLNRFVLRPVTRIARTAWRKMWGKKVASWVLGWVFARPVRDALGEAWGVVWVGVVAWVAVGVWFLI